MTIFVNHNGSITLSEYVEDFLGNQFYQDMTYYDYSRREAVQRFKQYLKNNSLTIVL